SDFAVMTEGEADGRRGQCRRVVDAVSDEQGGGPSAFQARDRDLLFGRLSGVDLVNPDTVAEVTHFAQSIARSEEHPVDLVSRPQVLDEGMAVFPRSIVEPVRRGVAPVQKDHTLETA